MDRLTKLAATLYPRWWRERYGEEFAALLEDARPGFGGTLDVAKSAIGVRFASPPSKRVLWATVALGLAGSVTAVLAVRPQYSSVATVSPEPAGVPSLAAQTQRIYSRTGRSMMIREFDLYQDERRKMPTDDVLELFRSNLHVAQTASGEARIEFIYTDPSVASIVVRSIVAKFDQPAALTNTPTDPYLLGRLRAGFTGLVTGTSLMLLGVLLTRATRKAPLRVFAACAAVGIAAAVVGLTLPSTVTSTALLRSPGLEETANEAQIASRGAAALATLSDEAIKAAIAHFQLYPRLSPEEALEEARRNLRVAPERVGTSITETVEFTYRDFPLLESRFPYVADYGRYESSQFAEWAANRLIEADQRLHGVSGAFEVLDQASRPIGLLRYRIVAVVLGPALGIVGGGILALIAYVRRRPIYHPPQLREA
jgi:hypothetical protein